MRLRACTHAGKGDAFIALIAAAAAFAAAVPAMCALALSLALSLSVFDLTTSTCLCTCSASVYASFACRSHDAQQLLLVRLQLFIRAAQLCYFCR
eukprot:5074350-Pleurochrysis_carterae.AAC.1